MSDPLRNPVSGEEFVPSASRHRMVNELLQRAGNSRETKPLKAELDRGVVLVRNDTGADLTAERPILSLSTPLFNPTDRTGAAFERPAFSGIAPDFGLGFRRKWVVLTGPCANGSICKAIATGVSWVKISIIDTAHNRCTTNGSETSHLISSESGEAEIIWVEEGLGLKWAAIRLPTVENRVLRKARIDVGQMLVEDLRNTYEWPQRFQAIAGAGATMQDFHPGPIDGSDEPDWFDTTETITVYPDGGFRGVAFQYSLIDVWFSPDSGQWQAAAGGHTVIAARSGDAAITVTGGGSAFVSTPKGSPQEISIEFATRDIPPETKFVAVWVSSNVQKMIVNPIGDSDPTPFTDDAFSPGYWVGIASEDIEIGCGLKWENITNEAEEVIGRELAFDGAAVAGDGLEWDEEYCKMSTAPVNCESLSEDVPCCASICDRLDAIEDRLDAIEDAIGDLIECCEANTACCEEMRICCDYNTACCAENRYCCEYLDARVDYCCGPGKPDPGDPGGGPECGRCVWDWQEEEPELIESCGRAGCDCEPPPQESFSGPGIYFTDCFSTIGDDFCCADHPNFTNCEISVSNAGCCLDGASFAVVSGPGRITTATAVNVGGCLQDITEITLTCDGGVWDLFFSWATLTIVNVEVSEIDCEAPRIVITTTLDGAEPEEEGCGNDDITFTFT